jgi:uncharacterized protein
VLVLLPPSEAKVPGGDGPALRSVGVDAPGGLGPARLKVLEAVAAFCHADPSRATAALKLPAASAADDLAANVAALDAPTLPALDRFSGVLYAALDAGSLGARERQVALASLLVFSGAFGFVAGDEPVPVHRVPAAATVPGIGGLTPFWRAQLRDATPRLFSDGGLLVDLRSTDYAAMWQVTGPLRSQVTPVRVLVERKAGRRWVRRVVSHPSKHGKGLLARELVVAAAAGRPARSAEDVAAAGERLGFRAETRRTTGAQVAVDLITRA